MDPVKSACDPLNDPSSLLDECQAEREERDSCDTCRKVHRPQLDSPERWTHCTCGEADIDEKDVMEMAARFRAAPDPAKLVGEPAQPAGQSPSEHQPGSLSELRCHAYLALLEEHEAAGKLRVLANGEEATWWRAREQATSALSKLPTYKAGKEGRRDA